MAGFVVGCLASFSLVALGVNPGPTVLAVGLLGAILGCLVGAHVQGAPGRARTVARCCAVGAGVVGAVSFLAGFTGPIILRPDLPQGPLLGIFYTGPLGTVAGAVLGAIVGLMIPAEPIRR
jgi:hypothetical protein